MVPPESVETGCETDVHFVGVKSPGSPSWTEARIEILVPSISALFALKMWNDSTET